MSEYILLTSVLSHSHPQGDSGSPANVDVTGDGDWYIVGLNSWGTGDRCAAATNAFVRITYFLDWIYEHVSGLPGDKPIQPPE